jgi:Zn finger protein HypA/HybF involved in hydrogenase expression
MKTNKEMHPNTDDALAAFRKHKEEFKCDCTFDNWLGQPCDEEIKKAIKDIPKGFGMALAGMLAGTLVADALEKKGLADTPETVADENANIECPLCHGKRGKIDGVIMNTFHCPDCGAVIGCVTKGIASGTELAGWLSQFNKVG